MMAGEMEIGREMEMEVGREIEKGGKTEIVDENLRQI
jgi:hypothetical protein